MQEYLNTVPIYKQLLTMMEEKIKSQQWPNHYKLPDEVHLAGELGVSRGTLRKAISHLSEQGLLVRIPGKGTFVNSGKIEQQLASTLISTSEELERQNRSYETVVVKKQILTPPVHIRSLLGVKAEDKILYLERVRLVEGTATMYLKNHVVLSFCPGLENEDFAQNKLFDLIEKKYGNPILWGQRYFRAVAAVGDVADHLGIVAGTPVMALEQTVFTVQGAPIEYSNVWLDSSRFELMAVLSR